VSYGSHALRRATSSQTASKYLPKVPSRKSRYSSRAPAAGSRSAQRASGRRRRVLRAGLGGGGAVALTGPRVGTCAVWVMALWCASRLRSRPKASPAAVDAWSPTSSARSCCTRALLPAMAACAASSSLLVTPNMALRTATVCGARAARAGARRCRSDPEKPAAHLGATGAHGAGRAVSPAAWRGASGRSTRRAPLDGALRARTAAAARRRPRRSRTESAALTWLPASWLPRITPAQLRKALAEPTDDPPNFHTERLTERSDDPEKRCAA
jgi:hypothetical protein